MPLDKNASPEAHPVPFSALRAAATIVQPAELVRLREQLKALGDTAAFCQQMNIGETVTKLFRENTVFQQMIEEQQARERSLELLTKPLADLLAARAGEMSVTADFFRTLDERFRGLRATFAALDNVQQLRVGFPEFAFRAVGSALFGKI